MYQTNSTMYKSEMKGKAYISKSCKGSWTNFIKLKAFRLSLNVKYGSLLFTENGSNTLFTVIIYNKFKIQIEPMFLFVILRVTKKKHFINEFNPFFRYL